MTMSKRTEAQFRRTRDTLAAEITRLEARDRELTTEVREASDKMYKISDMLRTRRRAVSELNELLREEGTQQPEPIAEGQGLHDWTPDPDLYESLR